MPREELVRAFQSYFKLKGAPSPHDPSDVLPVVIIDDASRAPYPPSRQWEAGTNLAALAANFSYVGIKNVDTSKSVCVVDYVVLQTATAGLDFIGGVTNDATLTLSGLGGVQDVAEEKDQQPSNNPLLGNVFIASLQSAAVVGAVRYPGGDVLPHRVDGPWTLGPSGVLLFRPAAVNAALTMYARGRFYAGV